MRGPKWHLRTGPHLLAIDACVAAVVTAGYAALAGQNASDGLPGFSGPWWLGLPVAAGVGAPLAVRRLWPLPVLAVVLGASATATLLDITRDPYVSVALAGYAVALTEPVRRAWPAFVLTLTVSAAAVVTGEAVLTPSGPWTEAAGKAVLVWLAVGAAWTAGRVVRARRARAARRDRRLAEEALAEERLRIARELHDIVSHSLSVIVVKAAVADHVAEARPEETRDAVRAIEQTGREALTEMRRALGVLRGDTPGRHPRAPGSAETAPPPGLDDLPDLVRRAERAGIRTELRTRPAAGLPAGTALTVYRIVQESLTNVVKHAGNGTRCQVAVTVDSDGGVRVEVADDGAGDAVASERAELPGGHGLVGMRERVMMYGGVLAAGPRPGGGFAVSARLPPTAAPASTPAPEHEHVTAPAPAPAPAPSMPPGLEERTA
ncbi:integral membrane sensor signal transduction histidine kinase [Streptomyces mobaraensis NBRC 13819 = DSM 40847]|uniref:histidine kinase n=1 Tax=Streptomyces mobaraensis (strain ATCC 29032 / DSM 40847 / JCM 4168 / NBRC 13819 / NCIMB 11159 / IPCR 16-22) TaxID=1223523 RepID=M3B3K1_STRM1|nr:sensor histidine kinase [Streptomyces mobaraensis]EMF00538.1 integral membrane sensor signal transduction histidine kinase [Streptomyces mobaraensis NBRC 13819 = DSM 40847]